ncbi:hypothetical protein E8E12_007689 [Didymella heteroderae]|uniref:Uncharacterized protein n=1 Tax=Didymella heteroderae TaxID=1769908 RepID=A0A9P4WXR4_9PLEO|nr:hypothetical protein E8E12_007689 [Didymella heteroderae]
MVSDLIGMHQDYDQQHAQMAFSELQATSIAQGDPAGPAVMTYLNGYGEQGIPTYQQPQDAIPEFSIHDQSSSALNPFHQFDTDTYAELDTTYPRIPECPPQYHVPQGDTLTQPWQCDYSAPQVRLSHIAAVEDA